MSTAPTCVDINDYDLHPRKKRSRLIRRFHCFRHTFIRAMRRRKRMRETVLALERLDDRALSDIGLRRSDLWVDPRR